MQLAAAYAQVLKLYPGLEPGNYDAGLRLVALGAVEAVDSLTWRITSHDVEGIETHDLVTNGACNCDPLGDEDAPPCRHVIAACYAAFLDDAPDPPVPTPAPTIVERHIERVIEGSLNCESPYSVNVSVEDTDGFNLMFTVRKNDSKTFFESVQGLRAWLKTKEFRPVSRGGHVVAAPRVPEEPARTEPQDTAPPSSVSGGGKVYRFHAETLHRNEMDGKILWAVKGADIPRYCVKFGMRIWPEVLSAAGFDPEELEGMASKNFPSLAGFIAEYVLREGTDKPDKILTLKKGT